MNMLTMLLARIAGGEKYEKTKKEDIVVWFAFLAAFPIAISISSLLFSSAMNTAQFWGLLLIGMATILIGLSVWFGIVRLRSIPVILVLALAGWTGLYFTIYRS